MGSEASPNELDRLVLLRRIDRLCHQKCISRQDLAAKAGFSRTFFSNLQHGKIRWPQTGTLHKIATALDISPQKLCDLDEERQLNNATEGPSGTELNAAETDRRTNPVVAEVYKEQPDLFQGWKQAEWDEIYSSFGVGGALTNAGVEQAAQEINQKRETIRQVQILLDTHQKETLVDLISQLYESVRPFSNFYDTDELHKMISERQLRPSKNPPPSADEVE